MLVSEQRNEDVVQKEKVQQEKMETYYRFQSKIYDTTRWSFLFGRKEIVNLLPKLSADATIMEIGCGTGHNLQRLVAKYPDKNIIGLDISETMLNKAARKTKDNPSVHLVNQAYGKGVVSSRKEQVDLILFSYSLSMINPHWSALIDRAKEDLKPGAYIAVVDFEDSRFGLFKKHMANNHVRMDSHIVPYLNRKFQMIQWESKKAYFGLWDFFMYVGQKADKG